MTSPETATDGPPRCVIESEVALGRPAFDSGGIDVYVCPSCGTFIADTDYEIDQYDGEYYTIATDDLDDIEGRWGFRWRHVLDGIVAEVGTDVRILDVGAGNGYFVRVARDEYGLDATGIEISPESVAFARDVLGVELELGDVAGHEGTYDVVTAFSVIEHVDDPVAMLGRLIAKVRPGGLLVLATPNPGCIQRRVKGVRRWAMICPPHHLNVLTRRGLSIMLERAGLVEVHRETISTQVKAVKGIDPPGQPLRRTIFHALRLTGLGADQLVFARVGARSPVD